MSFPEAVYKCAHPDCPGFTGYSFDEMADHVSDMHDGNWVECEERET